MEAVLYDGHIQALDVANFHKTWDKNTISVANSSDVSVVFSLSIMKGKGSRISRAVGQDGCRNYEAWRPVRNVACPTIRGILTGSTTHVCARIILIIACSHKAAVFIVDVFSGGNLASFVSPTKRYISIYMEKSIYIKKRI